MNGRHHTKRANDHPICTHLTTFCASKNFSGICPSTQGKLRQAREGAWLPGPRQQCERTYPKHPPKAGESNQNGGYWRCLLGILFRQRTKKRPGTLLGITPMMASGSKNVKHCGRFFQRKSAFLGRKQSED